MTFNTAATRLFMRSTLLAAWISAAATGVLASELTPPVVAAETIATVDRSVSTIDAAFAPQALAVSTINAAFAPEALAEAVTDMKLTADKSMIAQAPMAQSLLAQSAIAQTAIAQSALTQSATAQSAIKPVAITRLSSVPADDDTEGNSSYAAAALLMIAVVVFRRRGADRSL
ncbi:MAG: hypothetical protein ABWZ78_09525 [Burkholderiaceae bacterium]